MAKLAELQLDVKKLAVKAASKAKEVAQWKYCLYFSSDNADDVLKLIREIVQTAVDKGHLNPHDECAILLIPPVSKAKPYQALRLESKGTQD